MVSIKPTISQCLEAIYLEGSKDSWLKKEKIKKKLRKMKEGDWDEKTLDLEWQWRLACARLHLGDLSWDGYEFRNIRDLKIPFNFPHWDSTPLKGKSLLVFGEQGIGDEVMFASIFNGLSGDITVECRKRLVSIFERSFPSLQFHGRESFEDGEWASFDYQIPMGTLPKYFRTKRKDFRADPYLLPSPERVAEVLDYLPKSNKYIGISWEGRQAKLKEEDLIFGDGLHVNLQYDSQANEAFNPPIDLKDDIEGVFALISVLDLVRAVPTSVVHFAGSMGIPVDLIQADPFSGSQISALNWRFSLKHNNGDRMIWHPSVKIYRDLKSYRSKHVNNKRIPKAE